MTGNRHDRLARTGPNQSLDEHARGFVAGGYRQVFSPTRINAIEPLDCSFGDSVVDQTSPQIGDVVGKFRCEVDEAGALNEDGTMN